MYVYYTLTFSRCTDTTGATPSISKSCLPFFSKDRALMPVSCTFCFAFPPARASMYTYARTHRHRQYIYTHRQTYTDTDKKTHVTPNTDTYRHRQTGRQTDRLDTCISTSTCVIVILQNSPTNPAGQMQVQA